MKPLFDLMWTVEIEDEVEDLINRVSIMKCSCGGSACAEYPGGRWHK
jgi:hypothetical protein